MRVTKPVSDRWTLEVRLLYEPIGYQIFSIDKSSIKLSSVWVILHPDFRDFEDHTSPLLEAPNDLDESSCTRIVWPYFIWTYVMLLNKFYLSNMIVVNIFNHSLLGSCVEFKCHDNIMQISYTHKHIHIVYPQSLMDLISSDIIISLLFLHSKSNIAHQ